VGAVFGAEEEDAVDVGEVIGIVVAIEAAAPIDVAVSRRVG
jgi:hypothetical protein